MSVTSHQPVSILEVPQRDLRRQQAQGVPGADKKIGSVPTEAVCRSCTTMPVSIRASPPGGETGTVFPDLVPGAGTLPVGVQGRSALLAPKERNPDAEGG